MATWKQVLTASDDKETVFFTRCASRVYYDGDGTAGTYRWSSAPNLYAGTYQKSYDYTDGADRYEVKRITGHYYPIFIAPYDLKVTEGCKIYIRFRVNPDIKFSGRDMLFMFYRPSDADWDTHFRHTGHLDHSPGGSETYIDTPPISIDLGGPVDGIMSYQMPTGTGSEMEDGSYGMQYVLTQGQEIIIKRGYPMYISVRCDGDGGIHNYNPYDNVYNWVTEVECYRG